MHELSFSSLHDYIASDTNEGITLPVRLYLKDTAVSVTASLDTGATFCIFERGYGEALGLTIDEGTLVRVRTATGIFEAFGHTVTLETFSMSFESVVYFAREENYRRNVFRRRGWLDQVRLRLVEYEGKLYVSRYNEE